MDSSSGAVDSLQVGLPSNAKLEGTGHRDHALGACQNHTHSGPQSPPSGKIWASWEVELAPEETTQ